jgi:hypothetical protein
MITLESEPVWGCQVTSTQLVLDVRQEQNRIE